MLSLGDAPSSLDPPDPGYLHNLGVVSTLWDIPPLTIILYQTRYLPANYKSEEVIELSMHYRWPLGEGLIELLTYIYQGRVLLYGG